MKVVIAGGSGLVGRHLIASLAAAGHETVDLERTTWDPTGHDLSWAKLLADAQAVVDLTSHARLQTINALVDALASLPPPDRPRAFLTSSSVAIYDDAGDHDVTEKAGAGASGPARAWTVRESAAAAAERMSVRVVPLRLGLVLVPEPRLQLAMVARQLFGRAPTWLPWVGLDDAVGLTRRAIEGWDIEGPLNVVAPQPILMPAGVGLAAPGWLCRAAAGPHRELLFTSRRVTPAKALMASYEFREPDLPSFAAKEFGASVSASDRRGRLDPSLRSSWRADERHARVTRLG